MRKRRFRIDRALRQAVKAMPCFLCQEGHQRSPTDPCHIATFGARGIDEWWSMVPMCREHHNEQHHEGWKRFCEKYPKAAALLAHLGWEFLEANGQWKLFNQKEREHA